MAPKIKSYIKTAILQRTLISPPEPKLNYYKKSSAGRRLVAYKIYL